MSSGFAVYVGNVDPTLTSNDLLEFFRPCGNVLNARVAGSDPSKPSRFGFVEFGDMESLQRGLGFNNATLYGRRLKVEQTKTELQSAHVRAASAHPGQPPQQQQQQPAHSMHPYMLSSYAQQQQQQQHPYYAPSYPPYAYAQQQVGMNMYDPAAYSAAIAAGLDMATWMRMNAQQQQAYRQPGADPNMMAAFAGAFVAAAGTPQSASSSVVAHAPPVQLHYGRQQHARHHGGGGKEELTRKIEAELIARTVYVTNICKSIAQEQMVEFFSVCGTVTASRLIGAAEGSHATRFGFVEFATPNMARSALSLSGIEIGSCKIVVEMSKSAITASVKDALNSASLPSDRISAIPRTVHVADLPYDITVREVVSALEPLCGTIDRASVCVATGMSKRFGFVEFVDVSSVERALHLTSPVVRGYPVRISKSKSPILIESTESDITQAYFRNAEKKPISAAASVGQDDASSTSMNAQASTTLGKRAREDGELDGSNEPPNKREKTADDEVSGSAD